MSKPEEATAPVDQVDPVVEDLERQLRRRRIHRDDRRAIVDDVRSDLLAAATDGVMPEDLMGTDIGTFAEEAIEAGGYRPREREQLPVVARATVTAAAGLVAAYLLIVGVLQPAFASWFTLEGHYPSAGPVIVYGAIALVAIAGTLAVLRWHILAGRPGAAETVRRAALLLPIGTAAGIAAAMAVAMDPAHATTVTTVTVQVLLVALPVIAALVLARWWGLRAADAERSARGPVARA